MRRTYRSKKDTGGALDHKDVIQALDEKSSAFDAFYIQNLKQTKRELSCIGSSSHYGNAANKVRKRKYVKRIIKDPEPTLRDSSSHLVFLTPDKSIRVNKAKDLFDQLLDLSSPQQSPQIRSKFAQFPCKQEGKTYTRKKFAKIKKINCSSSDSLDSDKENSTNDSITQNVTDLQSYELLVEKEKKPNPKYLDESINNIVKNISALNRVKTSIDSTNNSFLDVKHRLTTNFQSPSNSPLCSTPFKEKYRSQSIFKFSPITFGKTDVSPNYVTIVEENDKNDSVVFVEHKLESYDISICEEHPPSPLLPLSTNKSLKTEVRKTCSKESVGHVNSLYIPITNDSAKDKCNTKNFEVSSIEISDFQTTEAEPFLGFSNNKLPENQSTNYNEVGMQSQLNDIEPNENETEDSEFEDSQSFIENEPCTERSHTNNSLTEIEVAENESSYGTCNSEESSRYDDVEAIKLPIVKIEKLSNSILKRYLDKIANCESEEDTKSDVSNELDSDDYASFEIADIPRNDDSNKSSNFESETEIVTDDKDFDTEVDSIVTSDKDVNGYNEEERCISFVTTRRRNEINDSLIFGLNNSLESVSSSDCDKTVLSNNDQSKMQTSLRTNLEMECTDTMIPEVLLDVTPKDKEDGVTELKGYKDVTDNDYSRFSTVTIRRSSKLSRESILDNNVRESIINDGKPGIVLQPGKKWERSLSIYRRMTMMTDHFDQSILDDEELNTKGRKYRQSVISTMEQQDKGSLHNESIISRRSTFVSKPCRSTIRIIKEPNSSRLSLCTSAVSDDLRGFLNEDCDDTIIELSKLSIADSEHEVTVIENFHETSSRVSTARDYVLRRCGQTDAILFDECYPETVLKNCRKIGEGVYGEVFLWRAGDGRARVMKIVPIAGTTKVNGERQKDFQEVISEIVIAMELSALRAPIDEIQREFDEGKSIEALDLHSVENATDVFNKVLAVRCVYGAYPSRLLDLWELYDECNGSENDNPAILPVDQQYIVLELANAGQDLESYEFNSAEQAHALFLQVAFGLAVGEESFQFEHRDLHWGNVLIAPTDQKFATFVVRGRPYRVARCGVSATIIDYSLSRLSLPLGAGAGAGDAAALYNDLAADESLFDAVGDYQFQVYRLMRDKLGNDWKNFEPYTNILWLHYTVDKMITALRYKRTNTKIHKHYIAKLKGIKNRLLEYGSAAQFVLTDNEF